MDNLKPYPVLEYVVNVIKDVISGIRIEYTSSSVAILKDGNDTIHLEQFLENNESFATIRINDPKDIIYSEDLLPTLEKLHEGVAGGLKADLQRAVIIINNLDVETQLIFQAVKDGFDVISNSYEFVKTIEKDVTKVKSTFKFGSHLFELTVINEPGSILVQPEFSSKIDPAVRTTIESDAGKVQKAVYAMLKEGKMIR
ncbi:MAG: hypothetical protein V4594_11595 [Bacteroidota bacterium]